MKQEHFAMQIPQNMTMTLAIIALVTMIALAPAVSTAYAIMTREQAEQNYRQAVSEYFKEELRNILANEPMNPETTERAVEAAVDYFAYLTPEELQQELSHSWNPLAAQTTR